jgi:endonuclease/exonuclease/phosphatase family metal-dependent hydrolase
MPGVLAEKLGMTVLFEPNYQFDGGDYGNAIFTSLPVVSTENRALPNPISAEPRGCLVATLEWQGRKIEVMNTHLGLNGQERLAQAEAIAARLGDNPVILAGDMNEHITAPGMQVLTQKLRDTFEKNTGDLRATIPVQRPVRRIDFILVSNDWEILSFEIIQNETSSVASDHLPCIAKINLQAPSAKNE